MRKILILSLAGAVVLAGGLVAAATIGNEDSNGRNEASPSAPRSTEPSPQPPSSIPGEVPSAAPPSVRPTSPANPAPPNSAPPAMPDPPGYQPTMVSPKPGMDNVHPVTWRRAEVLNDRMVRIHYESGVAPCSVLDRVEVDYREAEIAVSLFEGSDPAFKDAVCIMIAQFKAVDVPLEQPVNGRAIVEGNR
ncbi:MAG TPA: hypothetical protein VEU28_02825 [Actinomycetota bacterium]|nr:hypothetical protein [Actinomycetota bacterium]